MDDVVREEGGGIGGGIGGEIGRERPKPHAYAKCLR